MRDRRGLVNLMDAMVFITVLGLISSMLLVQTPDDTETVDIDTLHVMLLSTELNVDRFVPGGFGTMPLHTLLLRGGNGTEAVSIAEDILSEITPPGHVLLWVLRTQTSEVVIGSDGEVDSSSIRHISGGTVSVLSLVRS